MNDQTVPEITAQDLHALRGSEESFAILDVREPDEIATWAFDDSINIPMNTIPDNLGQVPNDRTLVVVCRIGARSMQVAMWLRQNGYAEVVNLQGGINAWISNGGA